MADRLDEHFEKNSSRSLSLDRTILSPDGIAISIVVTSDPSQAGWLLDLLENAEEYFDWIQQARMGNTPEGIFH